MLSICISFIGLIMVIIPQMLTLWFKYLLYKNSPVFSNGQAPRAEVLYDATVQAGYIHDRWDNYSMRKTKRYSVVLGGALMILGFTLSFYYQPLYFFTTQYIIWGGLLWLLQECLSIKYCLRNLRLSKRQLVVVAICAPFVISGLLVAFYIALIKAVLVSGCNCEYINRFLTF